MSVFQKYLRAISRTGPIKRRGLDESVYKQATDAWHAMRNGAISPLDNCYLHESSLLGMRPDEKVLLVFDWTAFREMGVELPALHYLETLSDLDVLLIKHVGIMDRIKLTVATRDSGTQINLRNQTSNSIVAFNELRIKASALGAIEVDMLSRHEDSAQIKRAEEILNLYPYAKYSQARIEARSLGQEILRDGFFRAVKSNEVSND